jgi:hypothetical protein
MRKTGKIIKITETLGDITESICKEVWTDKDGEEFVLLKKTWVHIRTEVIPFYRVETVEEN